MDVLALLTSLQMACNPLTGKSRGLPGGSGSDRQSGLVGTHDMWWVRREALVASSHSISFLGWPQQSTQSNRNLFSHSSGGQRSEIKVLGWLIPSGVAEGESGPRVSPASALIVPQPSRLRLCVSSSVLKKTFIIGFRVPPKSRMSPSWDLNFMTSAKTLLQIRSRSQIWGWDLGLSFWNYNSTHCIHLLIWLLPLNFS